MKQCGLIIAALYCLAQPATAQETSATAIGTGARPTARALWQVDLGYPIRASSGVTVVVGRTRRLTGYESQVRGVLAGVDAGLSGLSAKVGWADLRPYDAGMSGYSAEMVFVRPQGVGSTYDRDVNYIGQWMHQHPDGRRWIGFKVGTYLVDRAVEASGLSLAQLATVPTERIIAWAQQQ